MEALTHIEFSAVNAEEYTPPDGPQPTTFVEALQRDPIATIRSLIRAVRTSPIALFCIYPPTSYIYDLDSSFITASSTF